MAARETWKPVPGFAGYEVSNLGRVRSYNDRWGRLAEPRIMSVKERVNLRKGGRTYPTRICVLVMAAFRGPKPRGQVVRHLNDDRSINRLSNLAYGTQVDNANDAKRNGIRIGRPPRENRHGAG